MYKLKKDLKKGEEVSEEFAKQFPDLVEKSGKRWRGGYKDEYYFVNNRGNVMNTREDHTEIDDWRYKTGNYLKTEKQAEEYKEVIEIEAELRELTDWEKGDRFSFFLSFFGDIAYYVPTAVQGRGIYFSGFGSVKNAVQKVGEERVMKYLGYKF